VVREATRAGPSHFPVLVFDQFEEIVILDPMDWENQKTFFTELGKALADNPLRALFPMRED
jgi:hypothetical protein